MDEMDDRKHLSTTAFNLVADVYDGPWNRCFDLQAEALVRNARVPPRASALDVATGTGKVACLAARTVGPEGHVVGVDLSDGMLAQARRKAAGLPVEFRTMDAEALEFDNGTFDVVLCGFGVAFFPDAVRAMREMRRVLRPGGCAALSWWTKDAPGHPMDKMMAARLERYGIPRPPAPPEPWRIPEEPEDLLIVLEKGGFRERRVVREAAGYFITPEEWWQFVWATAWRRRLSRLPADSLERLRQETLEEVGQLRTDKGIWFNASALIGIGLR